MKPARLAAAAALLAALLGGYYLYGQVWLPSREKEEDKTSLLIPIAADKVEKIRISRPGLAPVEAAREKGIWKITSPIQAEADQEAISSMLATAAGLTAERDVGRPGDLAEFGLAAPVVVEFFSSPGEKPARLSLGDKNPLSGHTYVLAEGREEASLISGMNAGELNHSLFDLREKRFYRNKLADLAAFVYRRKGMEPIRVEKADGGKWLIVSPMKAPASSVAAEGLAEKFLSAKASGFYEEDAPDLSIYGLAEPEAEFTAFFAGQEAGMKTALGALAGEGGVFALLPGGKKVVRAQEDILKGLPANVLQIRLRELASFSFDEVEGASIISAEETLSLKKKPPKKGEPELWDIESPVKTAADPVAVSSLLNSIRSVEAAGFAGAEAEAMEARKALEKPELQIILETKKGPLNIRFSRAEGGERYWAGADGNKETLLVSQSAVNPLKKSVFDLRERRLFKMASSEVERVLIQRLGEEFELEKRGDDYALLRPEKIRLKAGQWTDFLWAIFELRFAGVISEDIQKPDDPSFGKPAMTISIFGANGKLLERAEIAKAVGDDKWYKARMAHTPGLYDVDWFYVEDDVTLALEKIMGISKREEEQADLFR